MKLRAFTIKRLPFDLLMSSARRCIKTEILFAKTKTKTTTKQAGSPGSGGDAATEGDVEDPQVVFVDPWRGRGGPPKYTSKHFNSNTGAESEEKTDSS